MFDSRGGISCRDEFVRFATIRSSMVIIVLFVNSGSGILTMSMQLIIWMSVTRRTDCEYHNAGSASWETSARAGTDAIRTLADRAKVYSQTQKAAGAGRQASVRTQNQNSMSYQTTQRRSAVQQGKNQKKKGKMSLVLVILLILFALSGINYLYRMFMYFIWFL